MKKITALLFCSLVFNVSSSHVFAGEKQKRPVKPALTFYKVRASGKGFNYYTNVACDAAKEDAAAALSAKCEEVGANLLQITSSIALAKCEPLGGSHLAEYEWAVTLEGICV